MIGKQITEAWENDLFLRANLLVSFIKDFLKRLYKLVSLLLMIKSSLEK